MNDQITTLIKTLSGASDDVLVKALGITADFVGVQKSGSPEELIDKVMAVKSDELLLQGLNIASDYVKRFEQQVPESEDEEPEAAVEDGTAEEEELEDVAKGTEIAIRPASSDSSDSEGSSDSETEEDEEDEEAPQPPSPRPPATPQYPEPTVEPTMKFTSHTNAQGKAIEKGSGSARTLTNKGSSAAARQNVTTWAEPSLHPGGSAGAIPAGKSAAATKEEFKVETKNSVPSEQTSTENGDNDGGQLVGKAVGLLGEMYDAILRDHLAKAVEEIVDRVIEAVADTVKKSSESDFSKSQGALDGMKAQLDAITKKIEEVAAAPQSSAVMLREINAGRQVGSDVLQKLLDSVDDPMAKSKIGEAVAKLEMQKIYGGR